MSLKTRKDSRTVKLFSENIKDFTNRESIWAEALKLQINENGGNCSIEENGVDNSGDLICGDLCNHNVDKLIIFENKKIYLEIKTIPENVNNFFTFKVSSLKSCLKQNAIILVPKKNEFYIIKNQAIKKFLSHKHEIYEKFSPNDLAVRIYKEEIQNMIIENLIINKNWMPKAQNYIQLNSKILFREKNAS